MGMFDYVRCEMPLPDGAQPKNPLHTKYFENCLEIIVIGADGKLSVERDEGTWHELPSANDYIKEYSCTFEVHSGLPEGYHLHPERYTLEKFAYWITCDEGKVVKIETGLDFANRQYKEIEDFTLQYCAVHNVAREEIERTHFASWSFNEKGTKRLGWVMLPRNPNYWK